MNHSQANIRNESEANTEASGNSIESLTLQNLTNPVQFPSRTSDLGRDETGIYSPRRFGLRSATLEKLREISEHSRNSAISQGKIESTHCSLRRLGFLCLNIKAFLENKKEFIKKLLKYIVSLCLSYWHSSTLLKHERGAC